MKRLTEEEKQKRGTAQRCRIKHEMSYDPIYSIPDPSFSLNKDGREYYKQFCEILLSKSALTMADIPIITRAARWFEVYKEADNLVQENGATQITSTGYSAQSGYFAVMEKADDRIMKIEALYGMSLASRQKITFKDAPKEKNPFDEL